MTTPVLKRGSLVGHRYSVERCLGRGSFSSVYLCRDLMAGEGRVALKLFEALDAEEARMERLQGEFSALARLRHPNLVRVLDLGVFDYSNTPFIVEEFVEGEDLFKASTNGSPEEIMRALAAICRVVEFLHSRSVVHLCLKPANVRLSGGLRDINGLKFLDYGLRRFTAQLNRPVSEKGMAYASPEVLLGHRATPRSDLYSLGVMAYHLLSRRLPFEDEDRGYLMQKHLQGNPDWRSIEQLEGGPAIARAIGTLMHKDPERRPSSAGEVVRLLNVAAGSGMHASSPERGELYFADGGFAGRDGEMRRLRETAESVLGQGRGRLLFVLGERGAGKTRLMEEFRIEALLDGWRVLEASCPPGEDRPYGPFRQMLARTEALHCRVSEEGEVFRFEDLPRTAELKLVDPALDAEAGRFRDLLTRELVRRMADRPTLLLLHDFHWADDATAAILDYLMADIDAHPVFICVSLRSEEAVEGAMGKLMENAVRQARAERLDLAPLSAEAVRRMIAEMTGEKQLGEVLGPWICKASGGNPLFAEEMLKHFADGEVLRREAGRWVLDTDGLERNQPPSSVVEIVKSRLEGLSDTAAELAQWLTVFNRDVPRQWLHSASGIPLTLVEQGQRELVARQVICLSVEGEEDSCRFRHDLISEVIRMGLDEDRRRKMHRRVAEVLEAHLGDATHLQELAMHFTEGRAGEKAIWYALEAMRACRSEHANEAKLRFGDFLLEYRDSLPEQVRAEVVGSVAEALCALGHPSRAVQIIQEELSRSGQDPEIEGRLCAELAFSCQYLGDLDALEEAASKGLGIVSNLCSDAARITKALLLQRLAFRSLVRSEPRQGLAQLAEASALLSGLDEFGNLGRTHTLRAAAQIVAGNLHAAARSAKQSLEYLARTSSYNILPSAHSHAGIIWTFLGRFGRARRHLQEAVALSERERSVLLKAQAMGNLAESLCRSGCVGEAMEIAEKALKAARISKNPSIEWGVRATFVEVWLTRADYARALEILAGLKSANMGNLSDFSRAHVWFLQAWLEVETGKFEEALQSLREMRRCEAADAPVYEANLGMVLQSRILHLGGQTAEALSILFQVDREVRRLRWPYQTCITHLWIAELLLDSGQCARAHKYIRNSIRLAEAMNAIQLRAHAHFLAGRRLLASDDQPAGKSSHRGPGSEGRGAAVNSARAELELALQSARQSDSRELIWRIHAELSRLEERRLDSDLAVFHGSKALDCLGEISNAMPQDIAGFYMKRPDRKAEAAACERRIKRAYPRGAAGWMESMEESQVRTLYKASFAINSIRDLHALLEVIIDQLVEALGIERAFVFLCRDKSGKPELAIGRTSDRRSIGESEFTNRGILEEVYKSGSPFVTANARFDPRLTLQDNPCDPSRCTVFCAPLKVRGRTRGVLYADQARPAESLGDSTINLFAAFSNMSAVAVDNAMAHQQLVAEKAELEQHLRHARDGFPELVGESEAMKTLRQRIATVAASPLDALVWGESGTGKELVARALHRTGRRAKGSFVAIDCGALSETLAEGELFGYRKGAFTGAAENRPGLLEAAQGGILFLDEIANLPVRLQPKLLRVLQEREVRRIGETSSRKLDIQVIAATNTDLNKEILKGRFRNDLYHRLNAMEIHTPPLRDRQEDIPLLLEWFLDRTAHKDGGPVKRFSPEAVSLLEQYRFPGNVRELNKIVENAYYSAPGRIIGIEHLPANLRSGDRTKMISWDPDHRARYLCRQIQQGRGTFDDLVKAPFLKHRIGMDVLRQVIIWALKQTRGRYKEAFRLLKIPEQDYIINIQFLKRHDCCPDFRPFRRREEE